MADAKQHNPWEWQEKFGYSQGIEVHGQGRTLYCSGQTSVDGNGKPLHSGDMARQLGQALDNLEAVLAKAGMHLSNIVRLNYYTTDVSALLTALAEMGARMDAIQPPATSTLLGVQQLFHPDLMVEIEATAVS